jgi:predicted ATPase
MTKITAIELENFQSIERRVRIELKPITLLYGPNSAGKSSIFDAIELFKTLLDPAKFDHKKATDMVDRWARRPEKDGWRETSLAIEFPFPTWIGDQFDPIEGDLGLHQQDLWQDAGNWTEGENPTDNACFYINTFDHNLVKKIYGKTVRIAMTLKVINEDSRKNCFISEFSINLNKKLIAKMEKREFGDYLKDTNSKTDKMIRWLILDDELGFVSDSLLRRLNKLPDEVGPLSLFSKTKNGHRIHQWVLSNSLSPRKINLPSEMVNMFGYVPYLEADRQSICRNLSDIFFFLGAMVWAPLRKSPDLVHSDRRAPKPEEALTVVDLGLRGWWDESAFAPSSPAFLFKSYARPLDEHYQSLAEVAHAELILRTSKHDFWGSDHATKHTAPIHIRAKILERVNHHLQESLFTEKLYQLTCASTLMVPIDLSEDNPWSYYALAQPAAVRLFLQDSTGQKIDLQDVGSGVPFVLPVLYAVSAQGFIGVQQPELHLHPALQSSLADVFIEELHREGCGQFVIETHSEHFLLRLLRRIRNTEKGKILSEDLKLTNDQIAVYYFDPQVGGGTFVSRQLVTPLGDFYNDWPRGFFSERNDDLFDE